jgi:hypothetical protein
MPSVTRPAGGGRRPRRGELLAGGDGAGIGDAAGVAGASERKLREWVDGREWPYGPVPRLVLRCSW